MAENSEFFDWNGYIEDDSEFPEIVILNEGDYNFKVTNLTKTYSQNGTPMVNLTLKVFDETQSTTVFTKLFLTRKSEWRLSQFFRSIGQKKHGEGLNMDWNKVPGATGRCKIKKEKYTKAGEEKEREKNEVDRYYDPPEEKVNEEVAHVNNIWATN